MSGDVLVEALPLASRLIWYAGCLGVIGASAFRLFVSRGAHRATAELDRAAASAGLVAAAVLLSGAVARLHAQTYASFGLEEPITPTLLFEVATALPPWSTGWMGQFASAAISLAALGVARTGSRPGWAVAHVAAVGVAVAVPFTGHAVSQARWYALPIVLQASHVLGAGLWIGGLFVLLVAGASRAVRRPGRPPEALAALVNAFSPLALCGAGLLGLTGVATASLYLGTIADLWTTAYGRVLLLKVTIVGGVAAVGFVNWQRVRPRLTDAGGAATLRTTATAELALAALVLAVTALLVGLPQSGQ